MEHILVTGATGALGSRVIATLHEAPEPFEVHALIHSANGSRALPADVVQHRGSYDEPDTLRRAFGGIDRLIFVSSPVLDPELRTRQHLAVVDAVARSTISSVVYTSAFGAAHGGDHLATEQALEATGVSLSIMRNALYTESFVSAAVHQLRSRGVVESASGGQRLATASIIDLADAAARASVSDEHRGVLELRGPSWTFDELAAAIGRRARQHVDHCEVPDEQTGDFARLYPAVRMGVFAASTPDLVGILGRIPRSISDVVDSIMAD